LSQIFETSQGFVIIGAALGVAGVAIGSLLPALWSSISRRSRPKAEARSAAMLALLALDDFVGASYAAVHDTPEFNPSNEGEFVFHTADPSLALPAASQLSLLGETGEEIMWLGNRVTNLGNALDSLDLSARNFSGFFERRQEGYSVLAAKAMDLIDSLIAEFELKMPDKPDYYRQREGFVEILQSAGERQDKRKTVMATPTSNGSNVTRLFPRAGEDGD
jgi:hypothetical protein